MNDLLDVHAFGLRDWIPVTDGESGAIVRRSPDGSQFVKAVRCEAIPALAAERDRAIWLDGQGIPGPAVLDWREDERGVSW
ncbi:MAG: hypothetical protein QM589_13510 [Thermomicrobiales bacterium]